ncbi:aspartate aminotransferase family protein [Pseudomonas japonica]|uniref:aspartate aminotransferase family protein n=1 Tax=Pseudomonas japonica TaxID=256466 RepID=UPI0015E3071F|nr:aspartate aminotransferase family protein [Pseudomonas japonica]MBA1288927.1 aspartate aminotransferase family protein [Pseudomonas japonica]
MTATSLMNTYKPLPLSFVRGEGSTLWDASGKRYLDAMGGVAVTSVGHCHPRVVAAIRDQAGLLLHTSNHYAIDWQHRLAAKLTALSGLDAAFFNNSGAEANETALKLARLAGWYKGVQRPLIVVMEGAFHGRTLATLAASDGAGVRLGFGAYDDDFLRVPFGDVAALEAIARRHGADVVAVLLEPVQGEGGVRPAPEGYLRAVRALCDRQGWLMMLDEVQTGVGRTGHWFAYAEEGVLPDVVTLAKGLANGVPIGACLARARTARLLTPGSHGSTFGGNPLACRVACEVLEIIEEQQLLGNARRQGAWLLKALRERFAGHPGVREVRGKGLMIGIELTEATGKLASQAAEGGLLLNVTRGNVVRLLPALTLKDNEARQIVEHLVALLSPASLPAMVAQAV